MHVELRTKVKLIGAVSRLRNCVSSCSNLIVFVVEKYTNNSFLTVIIIYQRASKTKYNLSQRKNIIEYRSVNPLVFEFSVS